RADAEQAEMSKRRQRREEHEGEVAAAHKTLADELSDRGMQMTLDTDLLAAYGEYVEACKQRMEQANLAATRPDIEHQLEIQRQLEEDRRLAMQAITAAEMALVNLGRELELEAETADGAADGIREWLDEARVSRQSQLDAWSKYERLKGLLDGRTELDWIDQRNELTSRIEAIPTHDPFDDSVITQLDLDAEASLLEEEYARLQSIADQRAGAVAQREPTLPDLAELE
ncbi:unnamed protein product, partial [marine sediment metagenome]